MRQMPPLVIGSEHLAEIDRHAEETYPEECCGILVGVSAGGEIRVMDVVAAENVSRRRRGERYEIAPRTLLATHKAARREGLEVVGYYHSHPRGRARPSATDGQRAWTGTSYLIVALDGGRVTERRSWRLRDDASAFEEEPLRQTSLRRAG